MTAKMDSLAAKVNELVQMCARLTRENAELRERASALPAATATTMAAAAQPGAPGAQEGPVRPLEGKVSRRMVGKALGTAAAGVVGAAALADLNPRPAAASDHSNIGAGQLTTAESPTTLQYDGPQGVPIVLLVNDTAFGPGDSMFKSVLAGWAGAGDSAGTGGVPNGVFGFTDNGNGNGVIAWNRGAIPGSGAGLLGIANGTAVRGNSSAGNGVEGTSTSARGGVFTGPAAQVRLTPGKRSTHPASGQGGDLYADKTGRLWFCKSGGNHATWHQIA